MAFSVGKRGGAVAEINVTPMADVISLGDRAEAVVSVEADESLPYARVREVLDVCREAGAAQLVLMTARRVSG